MADNIVESLFGAAPWQIQQQQNADLNNAALQYAKLDPFQRANMSMFNAGGSLAGLVAPALGMVNPQMQEAQNTEQDLSGIDTNDPQSILKYAQQVTNPRLKLQLARMAQLRSSEIAKLQQDAAETKLKNTQAVEIPQQRHEEAIARIQQAADAAKQRSEDVRLAIEQRRESAQQHNQLMSFLATNAPPKNNPVIEQMYRDYSNNPQVKAASELEPKVKQVFDYMKQFHQTGKSINPNDAALAKLYISVTTPVGSRAYAADKKELASLPDLGDRLGNVASKFFAGKDLTDQTRQEMFNYISNHYQQLDAARTSIKNDVTRRAIARKIDPSQIFGAPE